MKKVFVLMEEVDIVGVFSSYESATNYAKKNNLFNWVIEEFTLFD